MGWSGELARDRYGRILAYVFVDDLNVNVEMVRRGKAVYWTKYGEGRYRDAMRKAAGQVPHI